MKIAINQLRQIIKEEVSRVLSEADPSSWPSRQVTQLNLTPEEVKKFVHDGVSGWARGEAESKPLRDERYRADWGKCANEINLVKFKGMSDREIDNAGRKVWRILLNTLPEHAGRMPNLLYSVAGSIVRSASRRDPFQRMYTGAQARAAEE